MNIYVTEKKTNEKQQFCSMKKLLQTIINIIF